MQFMSVESKSMIGYMVTTDSPGYDRFIYFAYSYSNQVVVIYFG